MHTIKMIRACGSCDKGIYLSLKRFSYCRNYYEEIAMRKDKKKKGMMYVKETFHHRLCQSLSLSLSLSASYELITKMLNIKISNLRHDNSIFSKEIH